MGAEKKARQAQAKLEQAMALHQARRLAEAEAAYREAIRLAPKLIEALGNLGTLLQDAGRPDEAGELYSRILKLVPDSAPALLNLGELHESAGRLEQAAECYRKAEVVAPGLPQVQVGLGNICFTRGDFAAAAELYRRAAERAPDAAIVWFNLGNAQRQLGAWQRAVESYERALRLQPQDAAAWLGMGIALDESGNLAGAAAAFDRSIAANPTSPLGYAQLCRCLMRAGQYAKVEELARAWLARIPQSADACVSLGVALFEQERGEEAIAAYQQALLLAPQHADALNNLGSAWFGAGDVLKAEEYYRRALAVAPEDAQAHNNLGLAYRNLGRFLDAETAFRKAIVLKPDYAEAHFNLAWLLLQQGRLGEGWREYQWRQACSSAVVSDSHAKQIEAAVRLEDLRGKRVLLVHEQGLGDEIFFLRFAAVLAQRAQCQVRYRPSSKLRPLYERAYPDLCVAGEAVEREAFDFQIPVADLPLMLGLDSVADIPPPLPLSLAPQSVERVRGKLGESLKQPLLGVTWRGGMEKQVGQRLGLLKQAPIHALGASLAAWPGEVVILQRNPQPSEIEILASAMGKQPIDLSEMNENLEEMLALLSLLTEYVGVSNTNMHLYASLGKAAKVLVAWPPEWRWMEAGAASPWFPNFCLYRQSVSGGWDEVLSSLTRKLNG